MEARSATLGKVHPQAATERLPQERDSCKESHEDAPLEDSPLKRSLTWSLGRTRPSWTMLGAYRGMEVRLQPPEEEGGHRENTEEDQSSIDKKKKEESLDKKKDNRELSVEEGQGNVLSERKKILKELDILKKRVSEIERHLNIKHCDFS